MGGDPCAAASSITPPATTSHAERRTDLALVTQYLSIDQDREYAQAQVRKQLRAQILERNSGVDESGHATGRFVATGLRPRSMERIEHRGISLPADLFNRRVIEM